MASARRGALTGQAAEVIVDRDTAATKEDVEPEDGGQRPVRLRLVRTERDRAPCVFHRFVVIEVVRGTKRLVDGRGDRLRRLGTRGRRRRA